MRTCWNKLRKRNVLSLISTHNHRTEHQEENCSILDLGDNVALKECQLLGSIHLAFKLLKHILFYFWSYQALRAAQLQVGQLTKQVQDQATIIAVLKASMSANAKQQTALWVNAPAFPKCSSTMLAKLFLWHWCQNFTRRSCQSSSAKFQMLYHASRSNLIVPALTSSKHSWSLISLKKSTQHMPQYFFQAQWTGKIWHGCLCLMNLHWYVTIFSSSDFSWFKNRYSKGSDGCCIALMQNPVPMQSSGVCHSITSGSITTIAILVRSHSSQHLLCLIVHFAVSQVCCVLSCDTGFTLGSKSNRSGINYQKDFNTYKEYNGSKAGMSYHKAPFQFYNSIIFGATKLPHAGNNNDPDSSGLKYGIILFRNLCFSLKPYGF